MPAGCDGAGPRTPRGLLRPANSGLELLKRSFGAGLEVPHHSLQRRQLVVVLLMPMLVAIGVGDRRSALAARLQVCHLDLSYLAAHVMVTPCASQGSRRSGADRGPRTRHTLLAMGDDLAGMHEWIATREMKEASGSRNVRVILTPRRRGTDESGQA